MDDAAFDALCEASGLRNSYKSVSGTRVYPSRAARRAILEAMSVDLSAAAAPVPPARAEPSVPARCYLPDWLEDGRAWGVTCQLYGVRSARNQGIGDFEDLACLAERVGRAGGDFLGVNPLNALFSAAPERCSPFSPSNRAFLNPVYIALDRLPGLADERPGDAAPPRTAEPERVDYPAVMAAKLAALKTVWRRLQQTPEAWDPAGRARFDAFVAAGGTALRNHALFEALSHAMVERGLGAGWRRWPEACRSPSSPAVRRFAEERAGEVGFHLWLQWVADEQLGQAAARARAAGMRIGLYLDFAVGTAPDGSATWSDPDLVVSGASIGAPPDAFFEQGQEWGLAPVSPVALRRGGLPAYRAMLGAAMRHAGAIRIDHAMGLRRLFWVPDGMSPKDGCYVHYPFEEMIAALAAESAQARAIVIGEDLGTVPAGFSDAMTQAAMLSCRVLYFEWVRGHARGRRSYKRNAFVSVATHDLPPFAGWWRGTDIGLHARLGVMDVAAAQERRRTRARDRSALLERLRRDLPASLSRTLPHAPSDSPDGVPDSLVAAVHGFLARTPSRLVGIQYEDLCGAVDPVNVPGTVGGQNWRVRAPLTLEEAARGDLWQQVTGAVSAVRPRPLP